MRERGSACFAFPTGWSREWICGDRHGSWGVREVAWEYTRGRAKSLYRSFDGLLGSIESESNFGFFGFDKVDWSVVEVHPLFLGARPANVFALVGTGKVPIFNVGV